MGFRLPPPGTATSATESRAGASLAQDCDQVFAAGARAVSCRVRLSRRIWSQASWQALHGEARVGSGRILRQCPLNEDCPLSLKRPSKVRTVPALYMTSWISVLHNASVPCLWNLLTVRRSRWLNHLQCPLRLRPINRRNTTTFLPAAWRFGQSDSLALGMFASIPGRGICLRQVFAARGRLEGPAHHLWRHDFAQPEEPAATEEHRRLSQTRPRHAAF